jgi:ribonuclease III
MMQKDFTVLYEKLQYSFCDAGHLTNALTHPGVHVKGRQSCRAYERYEFLGDRVLGLVIAEWLLEYFPKEQEGFIAKKFTALVRKETLADIAKNLKIDLFVMLGQQQSQSLRQNASLLADTMEAIIAAIYYDGSFDSARKFIRTHWQNEIKRDEAKIADSKSALQEWLQGQGLPLPNYDVIETAGPDHLPEFTVKVVGEKFKTAIGKGSSKRLAEQEAAQKVLQQIKKVNLKK